MPIDIDEFESSSGEALRGDERSDRELVLEFLGVNSDAAFSRDEIADATGLAGVKLFLLLAELEEQDLVRHKGGYWAVGDAYEPPEDFVDPFSADALDDLE